MRTNKKLKNNRITHKKKNFRKKSRKYNKRNITKRKIGGAYGSQQTQQLMLMEREKLDFVLKTVYVTVEYFKEKLEPIKNVCMNEAINLFENLSSDNEEVDLRGGSHGEAEDTTLPPFSEFTYYVKPTAYQQTEGNTTGSKPSGRLNNMNDRYMCFMNYLDTHYSKIKDRYSGRPNKDEFKLNLKQAFLKYVLFGQNGFNANFQYVKDPVERTEQTYVNSDFNKTNHPKVKFLVPKEIMANQREEELLLAEGTIYPAVSSGGKDNQCLKISHTDEKIFDNWSDIKHNNKNYVIDNLILCTILINYIFVHRDDYIFDPYEDYIFDKHDDIKVSVNNLLDNIGDDITGNLVPLYLLHTLVSVKSGEKSFQMTTFCDFDKDVEKHVYSKFSKICLGKSFDFEKITLYEMYWNSYEGLENGPHIKIPEQREKVFIPLYPYKKITNKITENYVFNEESSLSDIEDGLVKYTEQKGKFSYANFPCLKNSISWKEKIIVPEYKQYYQEIFPNFTNEDITFAAKMAMFSYYPTCFVMNYVDPFLPSTSAFQYLGAYDEDYDVGTYYKPQNITLTLTNENGEKKNLTQSKDKKEQMKYNYIFHRCHVWIDFVRKIILIAFRGSKSNRDWEQDRYIAEGRGHTHERIRDMPGILAEIYRDMKKVGITKRSDYTAYSTGHSLGALVSLYASHTAKSYRDSQEIEKVKVKVPKTQDDDEELLNLVGSKVKVEVPKTQDDDDEEWLNLVGSKVPKTQYDEFDLRGGGDDEYFTRITPILFNPYIPLNDVASVGAKAASQVIKLYTDYVLEEARQIKTAATTLVSIVHSAIQLTPWATSRGEPQEPQEQQVLGTHDFFSSINVLINHLFKTSDKGLFVKVGEELASMPSIESALFQMNLPSIAGIGGSHGMENYISYNHYKHIFDFCSFNTTEKNISRLSDINSIDFVTDIDVYNIEKSKYFESKYNVQKSFEESLKYIKSHFKTQGKYPNEVNTDGINDILPQIFSIYLNSDEQREANEMYPIVERAEDDELDNDLYTYGMR